MEIDAPFSDPGLARGLAERIAATAGEIDLPSVNLMEVCGTHTTAIFRAGIHTLLPKNVAMLSGPGCPVCVTPVSYVDAAVELHREHGVLLTTFGDMVKVPGSHTTLEREKAAGAGLRTVYSALDALAVAEANPGRQVVFLAVGFETTAPGVAATVVRAHDSGVRNFSILSAHKIVPPALCALIDAPDTNVQGFLMPGHVSAIIGVEPYKPVAARGLPCVIAGFEPIDVLQGILMLLTQLAERRAEVEVQYKRCVRPEGNPTARALLDRVFELEDSEWRGVGKIPGSGLRLAPAFAEFDALKRFPIRLPEPVEPKGCICGQVLRGSRRPIDCKLFGVRCTPAAPVGACMVSSEGTCAAYYKYYSVSS